MDDYLKDLLTGQTFPEEKKPEELTRLLEQQGSPRKETEEDKTREGEPVPEEGGLLAELEAQGPYGLPAEENRRENAALETGEEPTALEETAGRRFLEELEREITSLSYGSGSTVVVHQAGEIAGEETAGKAEYKTVGGRTRTFTPEGLSRVFERDARRYP